MTDQQLSTYNIADIVQDFYREDSISNRVMVFFSMLKAAKQASPRHSPNNHNLLKFLENIPGDNEPSARPDINRDIRQTIMDFVLRNREQTMNNSFETSSLISEPTKKLGTSTETLSVSAIKSPSSELTSSSSSSPSSSSISVNTSILHQLRNRLPTHIQAVNEALLEGKYFTDSTQNNSNNNNRNKDNNNTNNESIDSSLKYIPWESPSSSAVITKKQNPQLNDCDVTGKKKKKYSTCFSIDEILIPTKRHTTESNIENMEYEHAASKSLNYSNIKQLPNTNGTTTTHTVTASSKSEKPEENGSDWNNISQLQDNDINGYSCDRCGKVFAYKYYRDKHLQYTRCVDLGDRKFPCHLCTRSFEKRDRLRIHILHVHEKHRPHKCSVCGKTFSQSSSLNKHMRVHSGERPYKCLYCSKAFTASSILRTHIRQHSGEKPFKCRHCGKAFASHAAHDSHVRRTHEKEKQIACALCTSTFCFQNELKHHMNVKHSLR